MCVCVGGRGSERRRIGEAKFKCVCVQSNGFFFHLGGAVCVARSLSLIFTLLLFPSEPADVVCTDPVCTLTTSFKARCNGTDVNRFVAPRLCEK